MNEQELREQIAKDIEDYLEKNIDLTTWIDIRNFRFCANIVRGKQ
jgi:hypothetical protein